MTMNKLHIALIAAVLLTGSTVAQTNIQSSGNIDTVILASTANYPDAMVSSGPAQSLGIPVLLTEQDQVPESTQQSLDDLDPENVVIVGGPSVVSEDVETELEGEYDTTRLWGTTQIGTSVEVADYFWTESEEAVVVQYPQDEDRHQLMAEVRDEADESPVLVSDEGSLSTDVLTKIEDLNVEEVEVYSTNAVNVTQDLEDIGVEDVEINEEDTTSLEDQLESETDMENISEITMVAAEDFRDTLSVPSTTPNSASSIISSQEEIEEAVNRATQANSDTSFKVVGQPDLAQDIADRIQSEIGSEVEQNSGQNAADQASESISDARDRWESIQEEKLGNWEREMNSNPQVEESVNEDIDRIRNNMSGELPEDVQSALEEAENALEEGDYAEAKEKITQARSKARTNNFGQMDEEEIREQVREERQSMNEFADELSESNQEMAEELREAESSEERRDIIREYREDRRDMVQDIRDEMGEEIPGGDGIDGVPGDVDEPGSAYTALEVDDNEVSAEVEYVGSTGGYQVQKETNVNGDTVEFHFDFQSPSGPATQAVTGYESEAEETLEDGDYTAKIIVSEDGETQKEATHDISVPGDQEFEEEREDEENEQDEGSETQEEIEIESEGQIVRAEAEYAGRTGGYGIDREVTVDGDEVNIVFNLTTPEDPATQVVTNYNPVAEEELEPGNYNVNAELMVDGEVQLQNSEEIEIAGTGGQGDDGIQEGDDGYEGDDSSDEDGSESDDSSSSSISTSLSTTSDMDSIEVEMIFSADSNYELEKDIQRNGEDIRATFDLTSSSSGSTSYEETITEQVESGSYDVEAVVRVDDQVYSRSTSSAQVN